MLCVALLVMVPTRAAVITFDDFSSTAGLRLNGSARRVNNGIDPQLVLRLARAAESQGGSAYTSTAVDVSRFSTNFTFRITNPGGATDSSGQSGADGLAFVIQSVSSSALGAGGGGLGYLGIGPSIAVEFDTWHNSEFVDANSNHIGIDTAGSIQSLQTAAVSPRFDDGSLWHAWINYDGTILEVRTNQTGTRPIDATLRRTLDVLPLLGRDSAFVGFTAATGGAYGNHDIVSWEYRNLPALQAGDADQDLDFDHRDLLQVQIAGKYLTGEPASWGEGDWNGAPGGELGRPPAGDGVFNQSDIAAALSSGVYFTGRYAALTADGHEHDGQTSIGYDARSGEI
jgi:hypothetical protein